MTDENLRTLDRIALGIEKLLREAANLRRDVKILHGRIIPFDNEKIPTEIQFRKSRHKNLQSVVLLLDEINESIHRAEYDLTAIRGAMDGIAADAISRSEMKQYIIDPPPRIRQKRDQG